MNTCVADDTVIINIQGIRHVTWGESHYVNASNTGKPWYIQVTYKGSNSMFHYATKQEAYAIFNKIRETMTKTRTIIK